ncbi:hypothetical protein ACW2Q0_24155 [Nocardia sp. R16R-3T]
MPRLEAGVYRGLPRRTTDSNDLGRKLLTLTENGRAILAERRSAGHEHFAELIGDRLSAPSESR